MPDSSIDQQAFHLLVQEAVQKEKKDGNLEISTDAKFMTYGFDSLDMMNILVSVEEKLNVSFEDFEITEEDSPQSFYEKISEVLEGQNG